MSGIIYTSENVNRASNKVVLWMGNHSHNMVKSPEIDKIKTENIYNISTKAQKHQSKETKY